MRVFCCAVLIVLFSSPVVAARDWLVRPDGTGDAPTIQAAVDSSRAGELVVLADGVFSGDGNRNINIRGHDAGVRSQSGDPDRCIVDGGGEAVFIIFAPEWVGDGLVFEGFTIREATTAIGSWGGLDVPPVSVRSCRFENSEYGIAASTWADSEVIQSVFVCNTTAIGANNAYGREYGLSIKECRFEDNGRDISASESWVEVFDCVMRRTGVVAINGSDHIVVRRCTIENCEGTAFRGPLDGYLRVEDCRVFGGRRVLEAESGSVVDLLNTVIADNHAPESALLDIGYMHAVYIYRCTIAGNSSPASALMEFNGSVGELSVRQSVVAFNDVTELIGGFPPPKRSQVFCSNIYANSETDWSGTLADWSGTAGNTEADPQFCDAASGDYRLNEDSPSANTACGVIGAVTEPCPDRAPSAGLPTLSFPSPNPTSGVTTVSYQLDGSSTVGVSVYDVTGRLIERLAGGQRQAGEHVLHWDPRNRASGIYFIRMTAPGFEQSRKLVLLK